MKPKIFCLIFINLSYHFVPSPQKETKLIESFCLHSWKETPIKDIPIECTYSIVYDEHHKNDFIITSGNSLRMINLLIQWMTWNYTLRHHLLTWWKTSWAKNFKELVEKLLKSLHNRGTNMSIKVHFLHSHLDKFPDNCGDVSDEQGERFNQNIKTMVEHYQRQWGKQMMADYCWSIKTLNMTDNQEKIFTIVLMFTKVLLFLLLIYEMIWGKYLLVLVYTIVLFLKT